MARPSCLISSAPSPLQVQHVTLELLLITGFFSGFISCTGFQNSNEIAAGRGDVDDPQQLITKLVESFGTKKEEDHMNVALQCDHNPSSLRTRKAESEKFLDAARRRRRRQITNSGFFNKRPMMMITTHDLDRPKKKYYNFHRKLRAMKNSTPGSCSVADLSITQGFSGYSDGIPAYTVQIVNLCLNPSCQLSNIHVACEAFSSSRPLDTLVFQRLSYNDCFVMNGAPLRAGDSVTFDYANSSEYPMYVISAQVGPCTPS
ncbi:unnamed protein product [Sphagnum balticum]